MMSTDEYNKEHSTAKGSLAAIMAAKHKVVELPGAKHTNKPNESTQEDTMTKQVKAREFWTVDQVAKYLGFKESTIYTWAQDHTIPAYKIGRTWRFEKSKIDAWIDQQETGTDS